MGVIKDYTYDDLRSIVGDFEYDDWLYGDGKLDAMYEMVDLLEAMDKALEFTCYNLASRLYHQPDKHKEEIEAEAKKMKERYLNRAKLCLQKNTKSN